MPTVKKSVKKVTKKTVVKKDVCPCGCDCGANCPCHNGGECTCGCGCGASVKHTGIWSAWRAFWRRGYCEWSGTSSRSEYWLSWIGNVIVLTLGTILLCLASVIEGEMWGHPALLSGMICVALVVYIIAMVIPAISMMTRRMHDAGLSAWLWVLYVLSIAPACVEESWVYGPGIGLIVALLPTVVAGNKYHKNNK